jgi:hypothetical protein
MICTACQTIFTPSPAIVNLFVVKAELASCIGLAQVLAYGQSRPTVLLSHRMDHVLSSTETGSC